MKRELTLRERVLLLILVLLVIVLGYFKLILEPINTQVEEYNGKILQEQLLVDQQRIQLARMQKMQQLLEEMKTSGNYQAIPSYDNRNNTIVELHQILASAHTYSLNFGDPQQEDYILSRPVYLSFTAVSYDAARSIIDQIHDSQNFNLISDLSVDMKGELVAVSMQITYYEVVQ